MNTKQQTAVVNSFSFGMFVEKSAEIPESERFLKASSTHVSYRWTLKGIKKPWICQ